MLMVFEGTPSKNVVPLLFIVFEDDVVDIKQLHRNLDGLLALENLPCPNQLPILLGIGQIEAHLACLIGIELYFHIFCRCVVIFIEIRDE